MDKRIKENIRVKRQIALAFLKLLKSDDITDSEMITISQITSTAKVSRMAYYRNFQSKTDIIDYYLSETLWKELNDTLSKDFKFWSLDYGIAFCELLKRHRDDILLLKKHGYGDRILSAFNLLNENLIGDMSSHSMERFKIYYAAGASYNAMLHWLEDGCHESAEDMASDMLKSFNL